VRALESLVRSCTGRVELHFTYDEEFGGEMGPGWLLRTSLTKPDLMIAAGFSYEVVTAHNGCLQMEVTVHGKMAHAAIPHTGVDALQGAVRILERPVRAQHPVPGADVEGGGHQAPLPQRRADRGAERIRMWCPAR
jgi:acetylornithine deacetylase/succinyl-diaminopimelate desuccinylase-like protein